MQAKDMETTGNRERDRLVLVQHQACLEDAA
jgi:hypothetical protein